MAGAKFTYTDPDSGLEFEWHGGAYIEIGHTATEPTGPFNDKGQASFDAGEFVAGDVINVWDYATDTPCIARTLDAFSKRCREWLDSRGDNYEEGDY